ncbi:MAG: hypothetical protein AAB581_03475 [Patescibacteria group bacterium]
MKYGNFTLGQVEAVINKLGGEEGALRLLRDEVEIVVKAAKSAIASLTPLIKVRAFDWVNPDVTNERFPIPDRLWNDYKEFHFGENVSSEEAVQRMQAEGYEPANSHELLLWEGWNGQNLVIALGSSAQIGGERHVLCLSRYSARRGLGLFWWGHGWFADSRFLGVRK